MAQETEIKIRIDDNEALQALREMASLVGQISDGLGGLKMSPDAVPSAPSAPSSRKTHAERQNEEFWRSFKKEQQEADKVRDQRIGTIKSEGSATFGSMTSPQSMSSLVERLGSTLTNIGQSIPYLGALSAVAGEGFKALGRSVAAREARLGEIINLEGLETEMTGVLDTNDAKKLGESRTKALEKFGMDSTQTRQFMLGIAGAAGLRTTEGDLSPERLARLAGAERTGVGAQSIASLAGALSQNIGQSVGTSLDQSLILRNIAEQEMDLRGSGVERFLGQVGGFVEGLTARGISQSGGEIAGTLSGISRATGMKGQRPVQIMNALSGVGQGAFNQIAAPLQEIAQMSVFAKAMAGSEDLLGAMMKAEGFQASPEKIPNIIKGILGGGRDAQATIAAISGIGTEEAGGLLNLTAGSRTASDRLSPSQISANLQLSKAQAKQTGETIRSLRDKPEDEATFQQIIKVSGEMERSTLAMTENVKVLTTITDAQLKISQITTDAVNGITKALDKLASYIGP